MAIPVTMLNNSTIASGRKKDATKMAPVMVRIMKFFISSFLVIV